MASLSVMSQPYYPWLDPTEGEASLHSRISPPEGFVRKGLDSLSFAFWLRHFPLKEEGSEVFLFDGRRKIRQNLHQAVMDIDIGSRDLQQCADAVMRLYGEYLYSIKAYEDIHFDYTSGDRIDFFKWASGQRPQVRGNRVYWGSSGTRGYSYPNFRQYLTNIFIYAGTHSLEKELKPISIIEIRPGDVFIQGGFPGHAVIVMDVAIYPATGEKAFLLAQSYMPAQSIHILKNPADRGTSPWYLAKEGPLHTPEWKFPATCLKRFPLKSRPNPEAGLRQEHRAMD